MGKRGSVLATVVIIAGVLFGLVAVAYTYFTMSARTAAFTMNRTRALASAEAGVALARHYLQSLEELPEGTDPILIEMEGDSSGWTTLPGGGRAMIVIDPVNTFGGIAENGAAQIRSSGLSVDIIRDIYAGIAPAYPSSYGLLVAGSIDQGFFTDGREVTGPVHSNGRIYFSSYSPDSTGDPYGEMFSTTSGGGFFFSDAGRSDLPHPEGSSVWVRPYSRHRQGTPWWDPVAPPVDFPRLSGTFRDAINLAQGDNVLRISAERVILDDSHVRFKADEQAEERTASLEGIQLIVVENGFSPVTLKTLQRTEQPLTVLCRSDIHIGGGIDGSAATGGGPLGIASLGDIVIPADPDLEGVSDWPGEWSIETDRSFLIRASLCAPQGSFRAQTPYSPPDKQRVTITGSVCQLQMGRLSSANSGYEPGLAWDQGLGALHPPYFPLLGRWQFYSWLIDPPQAEGCAITDDLV